MTDLCPPAKRSGSKVALVHPWLYEVRGGERVFFELARLYSTADIYFLFGFADRVPLDLRPRLRGMSTLQHFPLWRHSYRAMLPLLPLACQTLGLESYDLVISSSSGWAHGVKVGSAHHVCYMHTPPRYLWPQASGNAVLPTRAPRATGVALAAMSAPLRKWDLQAAKRVTTFIANSYLVKERIKAVYSAEAEVVYPPVQIDEFLDIVPTPSRSMLVVAELVPYKRVDLAIEVSRRSRRPLTIVGDGPDCSQLMKRARGAPVTFLGRVDRGTLLREYARAGVYVHFGIEDFGIATVEALAAGVPVVGVAGSGTAEIVGDSAGGIIVDGADVGSLCDAVEEIFVHRPPVALCRRRASSFSQDAFRKKVVTTVRQSLNTSGLAK